jgi:hypothetical protein
MQYGTFRFSSVHSANDRANDTSSATNRRGPYRARPRASLALLAVLLTADSSPAVIPGDLDASFDGDGVAVTNLSTDGSATSRGVAIQSDGKLVVAATASNETNPDFALLRYTSAGVLDTAFDGDGKALVAVGATSSPNLGPQLC